MYKQLIRPLLFKFQPESVHHIVGAGMRTVFSIPGAGAISSWISTLNNAKLQREVFGLNFRNPVGIAAGFDKQADLFNYLAYFGFGFVEIGTITPKPQPGNPKPRLFRLAKDKALINRMGFNNIGADEAVINLKKRKTDIVIGGNIGKNTATKNQDAVADYIFCFEKLFDHVDYFVVNVSCPNISDLRELQDQEKLLEILETLQHSNHLKPKPKPILLKVSPDLNFEQLDEVIEIIDKTKIQGVVAVNTTITRHNLTSPSSKIERIGNGGLSGIPLRKKSTSIIRYLSDKSKNAFPIIGVGGIFTPEDAFDKMQSGANLVQVYTGFVYEGPLIAKRINQFLLEKMDK